MHEGEDTFASLSKGVFVIPFDPESSSEAGPSRPPRPFKKVYDTTYEAYHAAYEAYESDKVAEQLDDIHAWLERCAAPPVLKFQLPLYRLPVAILQNTGDSLDTHLKEEVRGSCSVHGRDLVDLASATRAVAVGFMGEAVVAGKKSGRSPLDEVEQWYKSSRRREGGTQLVLHVEQAQLLPSAVFAELLYILSLHSEVPFHVLLSVPSISTFMASWTPVEPSAISVSVLSSGKSRKKQSLIHALARSSETAIAPLRLSSDLIDDLAESETLGGTSAAGLLKCLKWKLLHHEFNSPLPLLASQDDGASIIQSIISGRGDQPSLPGADLLEVHSTIDARAALDPAPRLSILHALTTAQAFLDRQPVDDVPNASMTNGTPKKRNPTAAAPDSPSTPSRKRRKRVDSPPPSPPGAVLQGSVGANVPLKERKGDMKEMEVLFNLWKSAGRSINLWDWLEAFRITMGDGEQPKTGADEIEASQAAVQVDGAEDGGAAEEAKQSEEMDEETAARLHATFVRFCEEARMLGLVRARGKGTGRRGDEVVKGIGLV